MKERRTSTPNIGPCGVPFVRVDEWEKWPKGTDYEGFWRIVGPTVEKHSLRFPLWKIFVAVYLEGLVHGYQVAENSE